MMGEDKRRSTGGGRGRKKSAAALEAVEDEQELAKQESSAESEGESSKDVQVDGRKRRKRRGTDFSNRKKRKERVERRESVGPRETPQEAPVEEETPTKTSISDYTPFQLFCERLVRKFQQKDPEEFFSYPVSAVDAPDYFSVITAPMDFSTIRNKVDANSYKTLDEVKQDVMLIALNAMTYNKPNTIYYLAAQKLQSLARYYFSDAFIEYLRYALPFGSAIPHEQLGLKPKVPTKCLPTQPKKCDKSELRNAVGDDDTAKSILRNMSAKQKPEWKVGFIDVKNGASTLNILVGGGEKTPITLGECVGALERGTPAFLSDYAPLEVSENAISYTTYGPFSSFAPCYDSTWAALDKRESDMLISAYGDRSNVADVAALREMVADSSTALKNLVDSMLDRLTDGEHSRTMEQLEGKTETEQKDNKLVPDSLETVLADVESLSNLGVDTAFVGELRAELGLPTAQPNAASQLQQNGVMLADLAQLQHSRLALPAGVALADARRPTDTEQQLAAKVANNLTATVQRAGVPPQQLVSTPQVHQAMGINDDDMEVFREFMDF